MIHYCPFSCDRERGLGAAWSGAEGKWPGECVRAYSVVGPGAGSDAGRYKCRSPATRDNNNPDPGKQCYIIIFSNSKEANNSGGCLLQ